MKTSTAGESGACPPNSVETLRQGGSTSGIPRDTDLIHEVVPVVAPACGPLLRVASVVTAAVALVALVDDLFADRRAPRAGRRTSHPRSRPSRRTSRQATPRDRSRRSRSRPSCAARAASRCCRRGRQRRLPGMSMWLPNSTCGTWTRTTTRSRESDLSSVSPSEGAVWRRGDGVVDRGPARPPGWVGDSGALGMEEGSLVNPLRGSSAGTLRCQY